MVGLHPENVTTVFSLFETINNSGMSSLHLISDYSHNEKTLIIWKELKQIVRTIQETRLQEAHTPSQNYHPTGIVVYLLSSIVENLSLRQIWYYGSIAQLVEVKHQGYVYVKIFIQDFQKFRSVRFKFMENLEEVFSRHYKYSMFVALQVQYICSTTSIVYLQQVQTFNHILIC